MKSRTFNILTIISIVIWIVADRYLSIGSASYGWILLFYVSVLFCGSYFIQWNFFLDAVNKAKTNEKKIALTFDDGPAGESTSAILDILKTGQTEAAFFCIGKHIHGNEALLSRIQAEGHIIGNHSYSHHFLFDLFSSKRMLAELELMSGSCKAVTGLYPVFFRPPYGVTNPSLKKAVLLGGFQSIGWSLRSYDTVIRDDEKLFRKIMRGLKPGTILLLHDTSESTRRILPRLLKAIAEQEYKIVRLDKLINLNPYA